MWLAKCNLFIASDTSQVVDHYYTSLENYMDADSVSHMMHCEHLITNDDYEAITAAPNDSKMNIVLLQYVRSMNVSQLSRFCEILKSIETHKIIGDYSSTCKCLSFSSRNNCLHVMKFCKYIHMCAADTFMCIKLIFM